MRANLFPLLSLLIACAADPSQVRLLCDASHPCPIGLVCLPDQTCGSTEGSDAGTDLATLPATGCTGPGGQAIGLAYACPVILQRGSASSSCATGYKLCKEATKIDMAACKALSGFYLGELYDTFKNGDLATATCTSTTNAAPAYWGCGRVSLSAPRVLQMPIKCFGFERAIDCASAGITCRGTLDDSEWTSTGLGVLCCPM
jgi:hypothetical protein